MKHSFRVSGSYYCTFYLYNYLQNYTSLEVKHCSPSAVLNSLRFHVFFPGLTSELISFQDPQTDVTPSDSVLRQTVERLVSQLSDLTQVCFSSLIATMGWTLIT